MLDAVDGELPVVFEEIQRLPPQNWIQENHRIKHSMFDEVITDHVPKLSHRGKSFPIGWRQSLRNCAQIAGASLLSLLLCFGSRRSKLANMGRILLTAMLPTMPMMLLVTNS